MEGAEDSFSFFGDLVEAMNKSSLSYELLLSAANNLFKPEKFLQRAQTAAQALLDTNAVALFVEVEVFMRGAHMNIIADAFLNLVRVGQRRPNFGPRTMAMLLENRHLRLRAPVKIANIGPTTQYTDIELSDEAYERARAAFLFDSADRDLREAKDDPLNEDPDPSSGWSSNNSGHHHSNARTSTQGQSALKRPRPFETRCPPPRRLSHLNGVCFQWVTDKHEKVGDLCEKRMCRFDHDWPAAASDDDKKEFRRYIRMSETERLAFKDT